MTAGGKSHNPDTVRRESAHGSLRADYTDGSLGILPGIEMFRLPLGPGTAIPDHDGSHALAVEVMRNRNTLALDVAIVVGAASGLSATGTNQVVKQLTKPKTTDTTTTE